MNTAEVSFLILGLFNIILGVSIKKFELGELITFYDPKKEDKFNVEKIVGDSFFLAGLLNILVVTLAYYGDMSIKYFSITQLTIIIGIQLFIIIKRIKLRQS